MKQTTWHNNGLQLQNETRAFREFIIPLKKATLLPLSLSLPLPLPVLAQFYFLFIRKKRNFAWSYRCLLWIKKSYANSSLQFLTPSPLNTFRLFTIPFLPFHSLKFGGNFDSERTSSVPCKCRYKRNEASHLTPCD